MALSFIPNVPGLESRQEYYSYAYFVVALLSSVMLPYETYFYAAGAIEVLILTSQIKLKSRGADLGLAGAETRVANWLRKIPGAE